MEASPQPRTRGHRRKRVVIAEDDDGARYLLRTLIELRPELQLVGEARNGAEAVQTTLEHAADLVLLDAYMPVLNGVAAAERLRRLRPETQLLLYTAEPHGDLWQRAVRLGLHIIVKDDFEHAVAELVAERALAGSVEGCGHA